MFDTSGGYESRRQHSTGGNVTDAPVPPHGSTGQRTPVGAAVLAAFALAFVVATTYPAVATAALATAVGLPTVADRAYSRMARSAPGGERA